MAAHGPDIPIVQNNFASPHRICVRRYEIDSAAQRQALRASQRLKGSLSCASSVSSCASV
jgi:hypothetical protein